MADSAIIVHIFTCSRGVKVGGWGILGEQISEIYESAKWGNKINGALQETISTITFTTI